MEGCALRGSFALASAFLVEALLPLMPAAMSHAMDDSPDMNEAMVAPHTDHRPTRWVVLRDELMAVQIALRKASALLVKALLPLHVSHAVQAPTRCAFGRRASLTTPFAESEPLCQPVTASGISFWRNDFGCKSIGQKVYLKP